MRLKRIETKDLLYYEATFTNGNLIAFTINELISQLCTIYGFKTSLFTYSLN